MYTRVKCERRLGVKRNMYVQDDDDKEQEETAISGTKTPLGRVLSFTLNALKYQLMLNILIN